MLQHLTGTLISESRSAENPSHSILDGWETGHRTDTGLHMNGSRALEYAPVWQAVSLISGDLAGLPLEVHKRDDSDGRAPDKEHAAYRLLARAANQEMPYFWFWRLVMVHLCIWNRAYAWVVRDQHATPRELIPLLPDRTSKLPGKVSMYQTEVAGSLVTIRGADVLHFRGISTDGVDGCDLVTKARNSWSLGLAAEKFGAKFFKNGARVSGVLQYPGSLRAEAAQNLQDSFNKSYAGADNAAKVILLEENAKFVATTINPNEGQYIETREEQVREVARWYNVDPSLLGVSGSVSYNSKEEANRAYWQSALMPWSNTIRWEGWNKLLTEEEKRGDTHIVEHNTTALLAGDIQTQVTTQEALHRLGVLTANQIARAHNIKPIEGEHGDTYYVTQNVQPTAGQASPGGGGEGDAGDVAPSDGVRDAARCVYEDAVQRAINRVGHHARRKAKDAGKFLAWLDDLHGISLVDILDGAVRLVGSVDNTTASAEDIQAEIIAAAARDMARVVDSVTPAELPEAVDEAMSILETTLPRKLSRESET